MLERAVPVAAEAAVVVVVEQTDLRSEHPFRYPLVRGVVVVRNRKNSIIVSYNPWGGYIPWIKLIIEWPILLFSGI